MLSSCTRPVEKPKLYHSYDFESCVKAINDPKMLPVMEVKPHAQFFSLLRIFGLEPTPAEISRKSDSTHNM